MSKVSVDVVSDAAGGADQTVQVVNQDDATFTTRHEFIRTRPGLDIAIQAGAITTPRIEFEYHNSPIEFGFMFTGRARTMFQCGGCRGQVHEMLQGSTCITCIPHSAGILEWEQGAAVAGLTVILSPVLFFETLREDMDAIPRELLRVAEGRSHKPFLWDGSDNPAKRIALQRILDCPYRGGIRTLYYEGLALELVGSLLHECFTETRRCTPKNTGLRPQEIERIKMARDILLQDLENPPTLAGLALDVGMSDTKLKRGFRAVFNKSVFQLYRDYRLDKALEYLENGNMNVSEAAYRIGYLSLGHFSRAFANRFGVTPSQYLQGVRRNM